MQGLDLKKMFAEGAKRAAIERGLCEKDAEALAQGLCKQARPKRRPVSEDDEEDGSWFDDNKWWMIPAGVGLGSFLVGADAGRHGRPDWNYFSNAGGRFLEGLKSLLGVPDSDLWRSVTRVEPTTPMYRTDYLSHVDHIPRPDTHNYV